MQKGFQVFFKKIVNSILNDLYGYLYLKILCQKPFKKTRYSIIKCIPLIATFSWEKLLLEFAAKLSLQSLCIIQYQLPGVYCRSQKKPAFLKKQILQKEVFIDVNRQF